MHSGYGQITYSKGRDWDEKLDHEDQTIIIAQKGGCNRASPPPRTVFGNMTRRSIEELAPYIYSAITIS